MPKIYRTMFAEGGKPKVGSESKMLGVRVAPNPSPDIPIDESGNVHPGTGGMSVAPDWRKLPYFLIPARLSAVRPGARGSNLLVCWSFGEGEFEESDITGELALSPDPGDYPVHGTVQPKQIMTVESLQAALAATRFQWVEDEA